MCRWFKTWNESLHALSGSGKFRRVNHWDAFDNKSYIDNWLYGIEQKESAKSPTKPGLDKPVKWISRSSILDYLKDAVQDYSPRMDSWSTCRTWLWKVWRNLRPFGIIKVSRVSFLWFGHPSSLPDYPFFVEFSDSLSGFPTTRLNIQLPLSRWRFCRGAFLKVA